MIPKKIKNSLVKLWKTFRNTLYDKSRKPKRENFSSDELLLSPEEAVQGYFLTLNINFYRKLVIFLTFLSVITINSHNSAPRITIYSFLQGIIETTFYLCLFLTRKKITTKDHFKLALIILMAGEYIFSLLQVYYLYTLTNKLMSDIIFKPDLLISTFLFYGIIIILFRLRMIWYVMIFSIITFTWALLLILAKISSKSILVGFFILLFVIGIYLLLAYLLNISTRNRFLKQWHKEREWNKDRLRMKQELNQAQAIQVSMLPQAAPQVEFLDIAGSSMPAYEVGGDYYDYFKFSDSELAVVVGDVSGHGLAGGLVLNGVRSSLYAVNELTSHPAEILGILNRMMKKTTDKKMFMTLVYAAFNLGDNIMRLANAGHLPILHYQAAANTVTILKYPSLPLGGMMNTKYKEIPISFAANDVFAFYSDGLIEATNATNQHYDEGRLIEKLQANAAGQSAHDIMSAILEDVAQFIGDIPQADDSTLVIVKIKQTLATPPVG